VGSVDIGSTTFGAFGSTTFGAFGSTKIGVSMAAPASVADSFGGAELPFFPRFGRVDAGVELPVSPADGDLREGDFFVSDMGRHSARRSPRR
jgi:hypothetical protein